MTIKFTNNASSVLAASIGTGDTSISLASGGGALFPTLGGSDWFPAVIVDASANREIVKVTARTGDVLTVVRAQEGTVARAFAAGDRIDLRLTATAIAEFLQASLNLSDLTDAAAARTALGLAAIAVSGNVADLTGLAAVATSGAGSDISGGVQSLGGSLLITQIANALITYAKIQNVSATQRILGRKTAGAGVVEEVSFTEFLDWIGSATKGDILVRGTSAWERLAAGQLGFVLQAQGAGNLPIYANAGSLPIIKLGNPPKSGACTLRSRFFITSDNQVWSVGETPFSGFSSNRNVAMGTPYDGGVPGTIVKLVYNERSALLLDVNGDVWGMGSNTEGELGLGDTNTRYTWTKVTALDAVTVTDIFLSGGGYNANRASSFFITDTGALYSCGYNGYGNLGLNDTTSRSTPTLAVSSGVSDVAASAGASGGSDTLILKTDGSVHGAGRNLRGELGVGDLLQKNVFTQAVASGVSKILHIGTNVSGVSQYAWSMILKSDGTIWSTGYNGSGQLGLGDTTDRSTFTKIGTSTNWTDIYGVDGRFGVAAAKNSSNQLYTWGYNGNGAVGDGTGVDKTAPVLPSFSGQGNVIDVRQCGGNGNASTYVRCSDGLIYAAGYNGNYNLSNGNTTNQNSFITPVGQRPDKTIVDWNVIGYQTTYGPTILFDDGTVMVGGYNAQGPCALGDNLQPVYLVRPPRFA